MSESLAGDVLGVDGTDWQVVWVLDADWSQTWPLLRARNFCVVTSWCLPHSRLGRCVSANQHG